MLAIIILRDTYIQKKSAIGERQVLPPLCCPTLPTTPESCAQDPQGLGTPSSDAAAAEGKQATGCPRAPETGIHILHFPRKIQCSTYRTHCSEHHHMHRDNLKRVPSGKSMAYSWPALSRPRRRAPEWTASRGNGTVTMTTRIVDPTVEHLGPHVPVHGPRMSTAGVECSSRHSFSLLHRSTTCGIASGMYPANMVPCYRPESFFRGDNERLRCAARAHRNRGLVSAVHISTKTATR